MFPFFSSSVLDVIFYRHLKWEVYNGNVLCLQIIQHTLKKAHFSSQPLIQRALHHPFCEFYIVFFLFPCSVTSPLSTSFRDFLFISRSLVFFGFFACVCLNNQVNIDIPCALQLFNKTGIYCFASGNATRSITRCNKISSINVEFYSLFFK